MEYFKDVIRPILDQLPSEPMHHIVRDSLSLIEQNPILLRGLEAAVFSGGYRFKSSKLRNFYRGQLRENTTQLGAGWDKPGKAQLAWHTLGCGSTVVGGITPEFQPGNPDRPRQHVFKDTDGKYGIINFLGLNSDGRFAVAENLEKYHSRKYPIIASVAYNSGTEMKNIPNDFVYVINSLYTSVDGYQLLISCPNVHGAEIVHKLHDPAFLKDTAQAVVEAQERTGGRMPTDIKTGGDVTISELNELIRVCSDFDFGIVGINTSGNEDFKAAFRKRGVKGGFSGDYNPYRQRALEVAAYVYNETTGQVPFTASGAIYTGEDAWRRHLAGSTINEIMSAPRIYGLGAADKINRYIDEKLKSCFLSEIIGIEAQNYANISYPHIPRE